MRMRVSLNELKVNMAMMHMQLVMKWVMKMVIVTA